MPEPTTKRPVSPGHATYDPVYETEASFLELIGSAIAMGLSIVFAVVSLCEMSASAWGGQLTMVVFFVVACIWIAFSVRSHYIYTDRLEVKCPLTFTDKTTYTIPFADIQEVVINYTSNRYPFSELVVRTANRTHSWRFPRSVHLINTFASHLEGRGVKVKKNLRTN